jgi:hypothetical protein
MATEKRDAGWQKAAEAIRIPPDFVDYRRRLIVYSSRSASGQSEPNLQAISEVQFANLLGLLKDFDPSENIMQFVMDEMNVRVIYLRNEQRTVTEAIGLIRLNPNFAGLQVEADVRMAVLQQAVDDTLYPQQWALDNIEAAAAWERVAAVALAKPRPRVTVAIIDSGVMENHEDLDPANISGVRIIPPANNDFSDDTGHGTMLAGTIAAVADNGRGIAGEARNVSLLACKFTDTRTPPSALAAVAAIATALLNGARVINASWHVLEDSGLLVQAILQAGKKGCVFVAAAGNGGGNNTVIPTLPASYGFNTMIVVMASDRNDDKCWFSSYGPNVDLAAPGERVLSTGLYYVTPAYRSYSGTSISAAHVSAAAALLLAIDDWTPAEIRQHLVASADRVRGLLGTCRAEGRLNLRRAIVGPFVVTSPGAAQPPVAGGSFYLVQWISEYVAPVVNSVEISFIDQGSGVILGTLIGLPNDGHRLVVVPNQPTASVMIRVRCEQKNLYADSDSFQIV